jgi:hypothetical protein
MSLKISRQGLQLCFRPCFNQRFAQEVMDVQNGGRPNFGNFEIPDLGVPGKTPFECSPHGESQNILSKERWCLFVSPNHGEFYEFVHGCGSSVHQKCSNYALTNLLFILCRSV